MHEQEQVTKRVAIGLSGGVDSSVAAALLVDQGYEVIGFTLHMFKEGSRCCSIEDVNRARRICDHLGIRHYVLNVMDRFMHEVVGPFTEAYATGRTPNPCIYCNRLFKFGTVLERALQLGCTHMATGHYVRIDRDPADGSFFLRVGRDTNKDQSYFLHRLTQHQLAHALFPLGNLTKPEVRALAKAKQLPTDGARETADLCFITGKGPAPLIEQFHPEVARPGDITDTTGRKLGTHRGIHHFTLGQREGLGIATGERVYVKEILPAENRIVVAQRPDLLRRAFTTHDTYWVKGHPPAAEARLLVRTRYRQKAVPATVRTTDPDHLHVTLDEPVFAITPGQAAVFYDGDAVLGGAWIEQALDTPA
ncbi:MAG TPA: tRNA 2-thiouridine(34) synthase MnmA [Kiritimatiellia bacterium]|nr:tRNA 2-thiouridine(34) synthase MnmA [Kiritimatiellia bacterium]HMP33458.1 tRNA 2-thiouridine(34) synthase MnmA [Kiritimatiellia bacterium]